MPLKLVKRPKSPYWIMRGTVRGQSIEESCGTTDKKLAEEIRAKREAEIITEAVYGKTATVTFAHAVADYLEHGSGNKRFVAPLLDHFKTADSDEAGHAFQFEAGHLFRSEAGRRSDLMSATGGLLPQIEVDDVSGDRIGQESIDFHDDERRLRRLSPERSIR